MIRYTPTGCFSLGQAAKGYVKHHSLCVEFSSVVFACRCGRTHATKPSITLRLHTPIVLTFSFFSPIPRSGGDSVSPWSPTTACLRPPGARGRTNNLSHVQISSPLCAYQMQAVIRFASFCTSSTFMLCLGSLFLVFLFLVPPGYSVSLYLLHINGRSVWPCGVGGIDDLLPVPGQIKPLGPLLFLGVLVMIHHLHNLCGTGKGI